VGVSSGKAYFETKITDEGLCRVGWSTRSATLELGKDKQSFGWGGTGTKSWNSNFDPYGEAFGLNDVIGCYLDLEGLTVSFTKNGKHFGTAFEISAELKGKRFYPAVLLKNAELQVSFRVGTAYPLAPGFTDYQGVATLADEAAILASTAEQAAATKRPEGKQDTKNSCIAIVLEPSRDLALQVYDEMQRFAENLVEPKLTSVLCIGGQLGNKRKEMENKLREGAHIVVGTIGILESLLKRRKLNLSQCRLFIMDEADSMVDTQTLRQVMGIHAKLPPTGVQKIICSATLHSAGITSLAADICSFPQWVDLKGRDSVPETVDHVLVHVNPLTDKDEWRKPQGNTLQPYLGRFQNTVLCNKGDTPIFTDGIAQAQFGAELAQKIVSGDKQQDVLSEGIKRLKLVYLMQLLLRFRPEQCMIFCRTRVDCDNVEKFILTAQKARKFRHKTDSGPQGFLSCVTLHSDLPQNQRNINLSAFKEGYVRLLICTDVAARGIDVAGLPMMINLTLPDTEEKYIHRVGRVGRRGEPGVAISLVSETKERVWWHSQTCKAKGKRNSKIPCTDTRLVNHKTNKGGCTTYLNELELVTKIRQRLQMADVRIPVLDMKNLAKEKKRVDKIFKKSRAANQQSMSKHLVELQPVVAELAELEREAQDAYHYNIQKWSNILV
jgi:ATP-dependent RNA helicase DDX1